MVRFIRDVGSGIMVVSVDNAENRPETGKTASQQQQSVPVETELKLHCDPETLVQLRNSPVILQFSRNKGNFRRLEATYYDTADYQLLCAGLTLRVRRSGRRYVQTIKRLSDKDPLSRDEWEASVAALQPDLGALPTAEIDEIFSKITVNQLVPIFITKVRRHTIAVDLTDGQIEVAFDEGLIEAGALQEPISEIELELKQGKAATLYQLGLALMDVSSLRVATQSKSARGYALALGSQPAACKAGKSNLRGGETVDEGIATLLSACHNQILANLCPAAIGREPEAVHQLRVALRRLRAALYLLRREFDAPSLQAVDTQAQRFAHGLDSARNWDVFIGSTLPAIEKAGLVDIEFSGLHANSMPFHDQAYLQVREAISDRQTNRFLLSLGLAIEQRSWRSDIESKDLATLADPIETLAARVLAGLERKARKRGRHFRHMQPEARHKLRILLKKFRYAMEFFEPLYGNQAATQKYLKSLSRLQDALGVANDIQTTRGLLSDVRETTEDSNVQRAIGAVIGWQGHVAISGAGGLNRSWRKFLHTKSFWPHRPA